MGIFADGWGLLRHEHLKRTRVMTHALIYEWEGTNLALKPLLLTGHQGTFRLIPSALAERE